MLKATKIGRKIGIQSRVDIVLYKIKGRGTYVAFLDNGSQISFVSKSLLKYIKFEKVYEEDLALRVFHHTEETKTYECVRLFYDYHGITNSMLFFVEEDEHMPICVLHEGMEGQIKKLTESGVALSDSYSREQKVDLFIGSDNYYTIVQPGFRRKGNLVIIPTKFGYTLGGAYRRSANLTNVTPIVVMEVIDDRVKKEFCVEQYIELPPQISQIKEDLNALWDLDHIGITERTVDKQSVAILKEFEENLKFDIEHGQYEVCLPWRVDPSRLPTNYGLAKGRLDGLMKKFTHNKAFATEYQRVISEQEERGFIERVPLEEIRNPRYAVHYLGHHGVHKDSLTCGTRIVFNCSGKTSRRNLSMNDCLYTGPSLVPDMVQVLMRFRLKKYACVSDIEKAYLMLRLNERDRDVTRFLWPENINDPDSEYIHYRFASVLFGATCSQFLLNATILRHLSLIKNKDQFKRGIYIDNLFKTSNDEKSLEKFYWEAQKTFSAAHLNLREWNSNVNKLNKQAGIDGVLTARTEYSMVLGLKWFPWMKDLHYKEVTFNGKNNKRGVLSDLAKVYDPLGFLLPLAIRGRLLLQNLWKAGVKWDDPLSAEHLTEWRQLRADFQNGQTLGIPRIVTCEDSVILHIFCDASPRAYGAVSYFTFLENKIKGISKFVIAKARVAPIKMLKTIPHLELTSILVGARLVRYVKEASLEELNLEKVYIWSDSQIALQWLRYDRSDNSYVKKVVDDIRSTVNEAIFKFVPGQDNPADLMTRGIDFENLKQSSLWREGPLWLDDEDKWPHWDASEGTRVKNYGIHTVETEGRDTPDLGSSGELQGDEGISSTQSRIVDREFCIDYDRYSTYDKLIKQIARMKEFASLTRARTMGQKTVAVVNRR